MRVEQPRQVVVDRRGAANGGAAENAALLFLNLRSLSLLQPIGLLCRRRTLVDRRRELPHHLIQVSFYDDVHVQVEDLLHHARQKQVQEEAHVVVHGLQLAGVLLPSPGDVVVAPDCVVRLPVTTCCGGRRGCFSG